MYPLAEWSSRVEEKESGRKGEWKKREWKKKRVRLITEMCGKMLFFFLQSMYFPVYFFLCNFLEAPTYSVKARPVHCVPRGCGKVCNYFAHLGCAQRAGHGVVLHLVRLHREELVAAAYRRRGGTNKTNKQNKIRGRRRMNER